MFIERNSIYSVSNSALDAQHKQIVKLSLTAQHSIQVMPKIMYTATYYGNHQRHKNKRYPFIQWQLVEILPHTQRTNTHTHYYRCPKTTNMYDKFSWLSPIRQPELF